MQDYKIILGFVTLVIAVISYSFYFRNIYLGLTKPHAFSWFVWSVISGIAFFAQISENGGAGAWVTGFTAVVCFVISVLASFKASEPFKVFDWVSLFAALGALILWYYSNNPTWAVVLVSIVYALGFLPTYRKAFYKPEQETAITFALNAFKFAISIVALDSFSVSTWFYPLTLVVLNFCFVVMLVIRRKQFAGN
jgi:hypothetical protein